MTNQHPPHVSGTIKALEWKADADDPDRISAGDYDIYHEGLGYQVYFWSIVTGELHGTRTDAEAFASQHHVARILAAIQPDTQHSDDEAVDRFAAEMKSKLAKKRADGRGGWEGSTCSEAFLSKLLREHVEKGDPLDVGNFAMMLHQRGERIQPDPQPVEHAHPATPSSAPASVAEAIKLVDDLICAAQAEGLSERTEGLRDARDVLCAIAEEGK